MRPDLDDILSGVQRLLMSDFVPALAANPFLAEQALYANLILEYCKKAWPRVHLTLAEEHGDLCATLGAVHAALARDGAATALAAEIAAALEGGASDVARSTLDVLARRNQSLRELVTRVVAHLDRAGAGAAGKAGVAAARAATDAYLARHARRQYAELELLGLIW